MSRRDGGEKEKSRGRKGGKVSKKAAAAALKDSGMSAKQRLRIVSKETISSSDDSDSGKGGKSSDSEDEGSKGKKRKRISSGSEAGDSDIGKGKKHRIVSSDSENEKEEPSNKG
ncbi:hypothetical protein MRX96_012608 [Rhipicephalus microplus]